MIRVLPYYHHLHLIERTKVVGIEYEASRRIAGLCGVFVAHEGGELLEVRLAELRSDVLLP